MSFTPLIFTTKGLALAAKAEAGTQLVFTKIKMGDGEVTTQILRELDDLISPVKTLSIYEIIVGANYATPKAQFSNAGNVDKFTGDGSKNDFTLTAKPSALTSVTVAGAAQTPGTDYVYASGVVSFQAGRTPASNAEVRVNYDLDAFYYREVGLFANDPDEGEILYCYQNAYALAENIPAPASQLVEKVIGVNAIIGDAESVSAVIDGNAYAAIDHRHGNITNDGKIGSTAGKVIVTGPGGLLIAVDAVKLVEATLDAESWYTAAQTVNRIFDYACDLTVAGFDPDTQSVILYAADAASQKFISDSVYFETETAAGLVRLRASELPESDVNIMYFVYERGL